MPDVFDPASSISAPPSTTAAAARTGARVRARAAVMLVVCCLLWGWSFPTMQIISRAFDSHTHPGGVAGDLASRALFNGIRFALAGLLYWLLTFRHQRTFSQADVVGGVAVGAAFGVGMLLQVIGLAWTLPSVSGFLTALAVVFAPLMQALVLRRRVGGVIWLAVAVALAGMTLLSWPNPAAGTVHTLAARPPLLLLGEILTVLGSVVFTIQILCLDHFGQRASPIRLTAVMFLTTALISLAVAAVVSGGHVFRPAVLGGIATDHTVWWVMATLVLFGSIGAMHLMNTYQPRLAPAAASIIYCFEPVFALLFSLAFGMEKLTTLSIAGGVAVVAAVIMVARKP